MAPPPRKSIGSVAVLWATLALSLAGCASASHPAEPSCTPPMPTASANTVHPGDTFSLHGDGAACTLRFTDKHVFTLTLVRSSDGRPFATNHVTVPEDGSFDTTMTVPSRMPSGSAGVVVTGFRYDCPSNVSCAEIEAALTVTPR